MITRLRQLLSHESPADVPFGVDTQSINRVVGLFALILPAVLWGAVWLAGGTQMPSISHYYYTPIGGDILVGMLSIIGIILILFYRYKGSRAERADRQAGAERYSANNLRNALLAKLAGWCALGVAFIPTEGWMPIDPSGTLPGFLSDDSVGLAHSLAAGGMFTILGYFSFFVFSKVQSENSTTDCTLTGPLTPQKRRRNRLYRAFGLVIFAAILTLLAKEVYAWLGGNAATGFLRKWNALRATFWAETAALLAFGLSWMIKGRRFAWLNDDPDACCAP